MAVMSPACGVSEQAPKQPDASGPSGIHLLINKVWMPDNAYYALPARRVFTPYPSLITGFYMHENFRRRNSPIPDSESGIIGPGVGRAIALLREESPGSTGQDAR